MRNVHWLHALAVATIIVSFGPSSSSDAKSTAYETDIVESLRASGSFTLKTEVTDDSVNNRRNNPGESRVLTGKNVTRRPAPRTMTANTKSLAGSESVLIASTAPDAARAPHGGVTDGLGSAPDDVVLSLGRAPDDGVCLGRAPHDVVFLGGAPHDHVPVRGRAPVGVVAALLPAHTAPDDRLAILRAGGPPHDVGCPRVRIRPEHAAADALVAPVDVLVPWSRIVERRARWCRVRAAGKGFRELDRAAGVQESGALREVVEARLVFGRVLQDRFHEIRGECGVRLDHQRDRAGHHRGRHARAAQAQVRLRGGIDRSPEAGSRMRQEERARGIGQRFDADAGSDDVRLGRRVDVAWSAGAEGRDRVVAAACRA